MSKILLGTDPELFLKDEEGRYVSAHDLVPGSKTSPFGVPNGAVQPDGVAAEFNIFPASDVEEFVDNINSVMDSMLEIIHQKRPDLRYAADPTAFFDEDYFKSLPAGAKRLGCEPDFNAYTGKANPKPGTNKPMRTGAFHIHIGFTKGQNPFDKRHFQTCREITKQLDAILFPMSMEWDSDETRRQLYGKMGSFRPKHYGLEYRPLSNAVLRDEDTIRTVYSTTLMLVEEYFEGVHYFEEAA